jgi:hypothetical protein
MQRRIIKMKNFGWAVVLSSLFILAGLSQAFAQPTDAQIKKDLTGAKTVSVTLGRAGTREWSSTYKKYMWTRSFTAKVKTDEPEIFVLVKGYAAYDIIGGQFRFWRTFITSNNYDGIPDPTAADVQALISKFGLEKFLGNYYFNRVIGRVESIGLAPEPKFEWHTPNSVSFNIVAVYTERTNDIGGRERLSRTIRIRLYRDNPRADWKNLMSTPESVEKL